MRSFGFDEVQLEFEKLYRNADDAKTETKKIAIKMRDRSRSIAKSKGLAKTGAGLSGIDVEEKDDGVDIGWGQRPNFHLYFHELGFHALDNRRGKMKLKRSNKGKRARYYSGTGATYIAPKPHVRPAFDELEPDFYRSIQKTLEKGV